jgi:hypothetical protein
MVLPNRRKALAKGKSVPFIFYVIINSKTNHMVFSNS